VFFSPSVSYPGVCKVEALVVTEESRVGHDRPVDGMRWPFPSPSFPSSSARVTGKENIAGGTLTTNFASFSLAADSP